MYPFTATLAASIILPSPEALHFLLSPYHHLPAIIFFSPPFFFSPPHLILFLFELALFSAISVTTGEVPWPSAGLSQNLSVDGLH